MLRNSLFVIAFCGLLVSCSKQGMEVREDGVIRLGVGKVVARAEVKTTTDLGDNIGIYGVQLPSKPADLTKLPGMGWGNALSMDNVRSTAVAASGAISWDGIYYYPVDPAHYVKFCAYHPYSGAGSIDAPANGQAPVLNFTLNGEDDIMYAGPVIGSRSEKPNSLAFRHALTQLTFKIQDANGVFRKNKVKVENIVVQEANTVSSMNIETGVFGKWSEPTDLKVPGIEGKNFVFDDEDAEELVVGDGIMLQPGLESFKITLATSEGDFPDVTIKPAGEAVFAAGHSYVITITFNEQVEIFASVTVAEWKFGGKGNVTIQ